MIENAVEAIQNEIDSRVDFITKYVEFGESHMVDFFTRDLWNTLIHPEAQEQLLQCEETHLFSVNVMLSKNDFVDSVTKPTRKFTICNLKEYLSEAKACSITKSRLCTDLKDIRERFSQVEEAEIGATSLLSTKEYMCNKKSHEVEEMSSLVNSMCQSLEISDVLDLGAGKGYLGTYLSLKYNLNVIGVDCSESHSNGAISRSKKFVKYWNAYLKNKTEEKLVDSDIKYEPVTIHIDADTDISFVFNKNSQAESSSLNNGIMLTALHACGDLSSTALRTFVSKPEIKAACVIGCCYHILTSDEVKDSGSELGFPMSDYLSKKNFTLRRNTRMLGLKALDRTETTDTTIMEEKSTRSLFYRAVLSVILEKEFGLDSATKQLRIGKEYSKSKDFIDYCRRSFRRLNILEEKSSQVTDESIKAYYHSMESKRKSLLAFNILREAFGPAVEALILLDKLLFLKEKKFDSYLVRLFDSIKSPRCYGLIALKK